MTDAIAHISTLTRATLALAAMYVAAQVLGHIIDDGGEALRVYRLRGTVTVTLTEVVQQ